MARKKDDAELEAGDLSQELIDQLLNEGASESAPEADPWSDEQLQAEIDAARAEAGLEPLPAQTANADEALLAAAGIAAAMDPGPAASASVAPAASAAPPTAVHPVQFMPLQPEPPVIDSSHGIELLMDVQLQVGVELGRSHMTIGDVLALRTGSVVELDKLAGEPVDVSVNGTLIARGEVVVVDEKFGVRITEVVSKAKRLASLA